MARNHGRILTTIWRDDEFLELAPSAQRLFLFLISQPELNHAGLLPLRVRRWVPKAAGLTVEAIADDLDALQARSMVLVDEDTEELLIRTHVRNDGVFLQPKLMARLSEDASHIESPVLRGALARELGRLPLDQVSDTPPKGGGDPARTVVEKAITGLVELLGPTPSDTPPDTHPDRHHDTHPDRGAGRVSEEAGIPVPVGVSRAGAPVALALPPAPSPLPPTAGAAAPPAEQAEPEPTTAQTLIAEWIDHCRKRPPPQVIKRVGRELAAMLGDGTDPDDVRRGLAHWMDRGLDPSVLPGVVNEVMNAAPDRGRRATSSTTTGPRLDPSTQDYSKARI